MEVKINREIRNYTETIFFGLTLRQFIFSVLACASAIIGYFLSINYLGMELTSWICILVALPFILIGFIKYNGMPFEKFIVALIRSEFLTPKQLKFESNNIYYSCIENYLENQEKENIKKW